MNEDKISKMERDLQQLRSALIEMRDHMLYVGGQNRMLEGAVFALLATHQNKELISATLSWHLDRIDADIVSRSESEAHLKGAQDVAEMLRSSLSMLQTPPHTPD